MSETALIEKTIDYMPKYTSLDKILETISTHKLSIPKTAKLLGIRKQAIYQMLSRHGLSVKDVYDRIEFSQDKVARLESLQWRISKHIDEEQIKKNGARDHIVSMGILQDKVCNLKGLSSGAYPSNITLNVVVNSGNSVPVDVTPTIDIVNDNNDLQHDK